MGWQRDLNFESHPDLSTLRVEYVVYAWVKLRGYVVLQ